ncbi:type II toxin-antitoxin system prevent-host-death family antitoxin [Planobispora longispora]|uniref:Antitoxin n=1 Tax=Planobispora longispora TaxID=28887 RepID=A0A8J3W9S6_9ACTN|nr:type II toxin-antitoxin system prevent-host-death family antitoxin [Planobispora longispora]GIH80131.1 hypothetical protein Plo01_65600 [Planobispora longispora]
MGDWQVQEAKQRFSEVVRRAVSEGPQVVTRHGEEVAVVIDIAEYRRLKGETPDFGRFLLDDPDWDDDVEFPRNRDLPVTPEVAEEWGRMNAVLPLPTMDGLIAATARVHGWTLGSRNAKDLAGTDVSVVNPCEPQN